MMRHELICGDVIDGLQTIPDGCVHCVVTSPPYWGLRDYGIDGQMGLESSPDEYVTRLVGVFREVRRVLRDDGVCWLNLGDSYATGKGTCHNPGGGDSAFASVKMKKDAGAYPLNRHNVSDVRSWGLKPKDMVGIPWRVALALQADGWYLRSDVIWSKSNPMPESVTDRPTRSHEYVFLLSKQSRYFYDADAVRVPYKESTLKRARCANNGNRRKDGGSAQWQRGLNPGRQDAWNSKVSGGVSAGRNLRTVWEIPVQSLHETHFATFPEVLAETCIRAGTSDRGCCPACGAPWRRDAKQAGTGNVVWVPTCVCSVTDDPVPCVVLDPFGGSGTVAKVSRDLGRSSVTIELNPDYVEIAAKRLRIGEQLDTTGCKYVIQRLK